jgi:iron complex transport system substrate-binding protein
MKLFFIFFTTIFLTQSVFACDVVDDNGRTLHFPHPAKRIISLAPDLTEILFAVGAGKKIVGVMQGSDYPDAAKKISRVASFNSLDSEKVLALHPDLIVAWSEESFIPQLYKLGIPVYLSHQHRIIDISVTMQKLGCLAGTIRQSEIAVNKFLQQYKNIQKQYSHKKIIPVFYQVWSQPLMTITKNSWISDAIALCGGKNIFSDLSGTAPEINTEAVIMANPAVIVGIDTTYWQKWPTLSAVKNNHVYSIYPDLIERASPRILAGVSQLCELIDAARVGT